MTTKHKHGEKKIINVINRTTSETLRLGEPPSLQPPQSRKKIQNSSSSFQVTGVSMTRLDFGDDSADDLDESHTDDISRVTDNETPSFSEDSRDTDPEPPAPAPEAAPAGVAAGEELDEAVETVARFKVVKVRTPTPISRGRWTCVDYLDNEDLNLNYMRLADDEAPKDLDNQTVRPPSGAVDVQGQAYISPHYAAAAGDHAAVAASKPAETGKSVPQGYSSILTEGVQSSTGIKYEPYKNAGQNICSQQKAATEPSNVNDQKDDILSDIKVALTSKPASQSGSATNNNNIDRKIEEALDAVKTHLMVAVHKEVDFLKTRVSTLEGRVNELEIENSILRVNYLLFKS